MMKRLSAITVVNRSDSEVDRIQTNGSSISGQNILLSGPSGSQAMNDFLGYHRVSKNHIGEFRIQN